MSPKNLIDMKKRYIAELEARIKENGFIQPHFIIKEVMDELFDELIRIEKREEVNDSRK